MQNRLCSHVMNDHINFQSLVLTYKSYSINSPKVPIYPTCSLSVSQHTILVLLHTPVCYMYHKHTRLWDRAFSCFDPKLWKSLPAKLMSSPSLDNFKKQLHKNHIVFLDIFKLYRLYLHKNVKFQLLLYVSLVHLMFLFLSCKALCYIDEKAIYNCEFYVISVGFYILYWLMLVKLWWIEHYPFSHNFSYLVSHSHLSQCQYSSSTFHPMWACV